MTKRQTDESAYSRKIRSEYDKIARRLQKEGVLDKNWRLTAKGRKDEDKWLEQLREAGVLAKPRVASPGGSYHRGKGCGRGEHQYEDRGSYWKCKLCGSSRTKPKQKRQKSKTSTRSRVEPPPGSSGGGAE